MSDERSTAENLTFVGGKAVEQHEGLDSNVPDDTRAEAMKAVREAIKGAAAEAKENTARAKDTDPFKPEGAKAEPERDPDTGKFLRKDEAKKEPEAAEEELPDPAKGTVKQLLKNREKLAKAKQEANGARSELEQERRKIADETQRIRETWSQLQVMQQQVEAARRSMDLLKKDPARAVREIGWEPENFIVDLAREGTPEGQLARQNREMRQQLDEIRQWKEDQAKHQEAAQQQHAVQQAEQYRAHIERTFIGSALNEEKYPHVTEFYKGRERMLLAAGDLAAVEFRQLSGGREASLDEIIDFLEDDLAERASSWYTKKSGAAKAKAPDATSKPAKGSKGKTLSPEASSERRSLGRNSLKDLDDEERIQAAREAVGLALED